MCHRLVAGSRAENESRFLCWDWSQSPPGWLQDQTLASEQAAAAAAEARAALADRTAELQAVRDELASMRQVGGVFKHQRDLC